MVPGIAKLFQWLKFSDHICLFVFISGLWSCCQCARMSKALPKLPMSADARGLYGVFRCNRGDVASPSGHELGELCVGTGPSVCLIFLNCMHTMTSQALSMNTENEWWEDALLASFPVYVSTIPKIANASTGWGPYESAGLEVLSCPSGQH